MPPLTILIKPASSACNMSCQYCFYQDVSEHRQHAFMGMLSIEMMEQVIAQAMQYAEGYCTFAFQGGEPTLAGLPFFEQVVALEQKYKRPSVAIHNAIQTNGLLIDEAWAAFFAANDFLVGLSLDGPADIHNLNRKSRAGKDTFNHIRRAAELFDRQHVQYNILCVVTGQTARSIEKVYRFFRKQGFRYLQFIPCLDPFGQARETMPYSLSVEKYANYLIRIFDLWFDDLSRGEYLSVRHLDNWFAMFCGYPPEACNMSGHCSVQFVVEGDGSVYPCDFYVLDEWKIGTIGTDGFAQMFGSETAQKFLSASLPVPEDCRACRFYAICRNGCRRERELLPDGTVGKNIYCEAYQTFFSSRAEQIEAAIRLYRDRINRAQRPADRA